MLQRNNRASSVVISLISAMLCITAFSMCNSGNYQQLGIPIPDDAKTVKLEQVLANPAEFNGKKIVMNGVISGQCPSLCEFFYKEDIHKATVFPQGYSFPKLETGRPVTIYAEITAGEENVVVSALGIRVQKGS